MNRISVGAWLCLCVAPSWVKAQADDKPAYNPVVAPASDEAEKGLARLRVPDGLKASVYAAEPLLAHPVAIAPDEHNRWFVVETFRHTDGVTDTRNHMNWLVDDLACRTVEDRVAMYKKYSSPEEFAKYSAEHDRLRLLEDRDGDGAADHATVFADGFNRLETGLGAGVLARRGDVYFTCIPDLWRLRDTNGDGKADTRDRLHSGYGVHVQFLGHDLHGLIVGPDGRLYFSVGDRGLNVKTKDGKSLLCPDTGAVLRCDLDGSNLEIIHMGLRNPQELAFDEFGDLFTVDNNSDGGDRARLAWVVPGGDSGWRVGYQFIERPTQRGPWNSEKMWQPENDAQPAFLVPPLANISDGPGGLAYNPGTALRAEDRGRFFLADFRGSPGDSGVRSFAIRPKGAAFELVDDKPFVWGLQATDVAFGTDGAMYISDWVEGWNKTGKGRIYKVFAPGGAEQDATRSTRALIESPMDGRKAAELARLLDHDDMRVRLEAQFELADRMGETGQPEGVSHWEDVAAVQGIAMGSLQGKASLRARVHAISAQAMWERRRNAPHSVIWNQLMADREPEIRILAMRNIADFLSGSAKSFDGPIEDAILAALKDPSPRVRFFAALAAGAHGKSTWLDPLRAFLAENSDQDAYLRHAGVMGLVGIGRRDLNALRTLAGDPSPSVRLGVLLALRRLQSVEIARFLKDPDTRLVTEAARAIHDVPIDGALGALADLPIDKSTSPPLLRRAIAARIRRGSPTDVDSLASFAVADGITSAPRMEAVSALGSWAEAVPLDRVTGLYRPIESRDAAAAAHAIEMIAPKLLADENDLVVQAATKAVASLRVRAFLPTLLELATQADRSSNTRIEALRALDLLEAPTLSEVVKVAIHDQNRKVRAEALAIMSRIDPKAALVVLGEVLKQGTQDEKQRAFATLASIEDPQSAVLLGEWLELLTRGAVEPSLRLDLIEAAKLCDSAPLKSRLARYENSLPKENPLARYEVALEGGQAERGERVYRENAAVSCVKCHKVWGQGGEVGPELTGIGAKKDRRYLLEAVVLPNQQIAEGFETKVLALKDGTLVSGVVKKTDDEAITLIDADARMTKIARQDIEEETKGQSAMPHDLVQKITPLELRDLIEYLSSLK